MRQPATDGEDNYCNVRAWPWPWLWLLRPKLKIEGPCLGLEVQCLGLATKGLGPSEPGLDVGLRCSGLVNISVYRTD